MSGTGDDRLTRGTGTEEMVRVRGNENDTGASQDNRHNINNPTKNWNKDKNREGQGHGKIVPSF